MPEETELEVEIPASEGEIPEGEIPAQEETPPAQEKPKEKLRKVVQPVDATGKAIGQPHVYLYEDQADLERQMEQTVINGTRKIHELTRRNVLEDPEGLPEGAELEEEAPVWKPRELTEEEKFIVQNDPEKAFDILYAARTGLSPAEKAKVDRENYENTKRLAMVAETEQFAKEHPEYIVCNDNAQAMLKYMERNRMKWTSQNLDRAYRKLSADGLLVEAEVEPEPVAAPRTEAAAEPPEVPETPVRPAAQPRTSFPTAIRNATGRATAPVAPKKGPSAEEIAKMDSDTYRKHFPELRDAR